MTDTPTTGHHPDHPHYPLTDDLPSDVIRRVLGNLPAPHPKALLKAVDDYHAELWADEPIPGPTYPRSITKADLITALTLDADSVIDDHLGRRDYTEGEVNDALNFLLERELATQAGDDAYAMTKAGLAALNE